MKSVAANWNWLSLGPAKEKDGGQLWNFKRESEFCNTLLENCLQDNDFDKNSFVLQWLLKEI